MVHSFLRAAFRNLLSRKTQSVINIASLAIGLTVFGFAFVYVKHELSYDRGWPDGERVHRLTVEQRGLPGAQEGVLTSVTAAERARILDYFGADIAASTRNVSTVAWLPGSEPIRIGLSLVDAQYLDIFQLEAIDGDLSRVLAGPGFIAVEESEAARLGLDGRIGERITLKSFYDENVGVEYELAAIFRVPKPSTFTPPLFTLMHEYSLPMFSQQGGRQYVPWEGMSPLWIKLRDGLGTQEFNARQPAFVDELTTFDAALGASRNITDHLSYRWQPLREIHFNPVGFEGSSGFAGDYGRVVTFAAVGLLVLLVGCSNSISLSLAAAIERRREIGVRKASGALPRDIAWQQLGESTLLALLALLPAIAALELLTPVFQAMLSFSARVEPGWFEYLLLCIIAAMVGLACGAYPALVLAATRPQAVLRAGPIQGAKGGVPMRTLLVAVQFCLASMLLVGTAALYLQLAVARAQPLGFDASNIVMTIANQGVSRDVMRTEFAKIPGVTDVIIASNMPNSGLPVGVNARPFVRNIGDELEVRAELGTGDHDFIELFGMRMLAGRDFDARFDQFNEAGTEYADGAGQRIVINASAVRELGFASPEEAVEQTIFMRMLNRGEVTHMPMRILGVVEDNQYVSLRRRPGPEVYMSIASASTRPGNLMVKYEDAAESTIQQRLTEAAQRLNGAPLNGVIFTETLLESAFRQEQNESRLLLICGGLAILLASIGLYGLAAFTMERQVKEVGVRKVMGAGVGAIVGLYLWRFSRPIVLANVVAWPIAIYFVLQWIQRFPYQMERAWLVPLCIATLAAVLLIAMLTVSVITARAATVNPVRSLRYE